MNLERAVRVAHKIAPPWLQDDAGQEAALWCLRYGYEVQARWVVADLLRREPRHQQGGEPDVARDLRRERMDQGQYAGQPPSRVGSHPCQACGALLWGRRVTCNKVCRNSLDRVGRGA